MLISSNSEEQLGRNYAAQIEQEVTVIQDPVAQAWLDRVGSALVKHSPNTSQTFKFAFTSSGEVNAFAIPGGYCYINQGLVLFADNEAQVVSVIGHEINHVTKRHGIMALQRSLGLQVGLGILSVAVTGSDYASIASLAAESGSMLAMRSFGRTDEREADRYGVEAMYKAGWDPREAAAFFSKLGQKSKGGSSWVAAFTSTHPLSEERVENIRSQIEKYDLNQNLTVNSDEFISIQNRFRDKFGEVGSKK